MHNSASQTAGLCVYSRQFSHRVKGISMSTFKPEEMKALEAGGNGVSPPAFSIPQQSSPSRNAQHTSNPHLTHAAPLLATTVLVLRLEHRCTWPSGDHQNCRSQLTGQPTSLQRLQQLLHLYPALWLADHMLHSGTQQKSRTG